MRYRPLAAADFLQIEPWDPVEAPLAELRAPGFAEMAERSVDRGAGGFAWAALQDGRVMALWGAAIISRSALGNVGRTWALFDRRMPKTSWAGLTRYVTVMLDAAQRAKVPRLETTIREDFVNGHRWARMLGFREAPAPGARGSLLRAYGPDGSDHRFYVRPYVPSRHNVAEDPACLG